MLQQAGKEAAKGEESLPVAQKVSEQPAYIARKGRGQWCLHQSQQSPHICTNNCTAHYANEGLCLHQSWLFSWD
jgi:hypothetical protein